MKNNDHIRVLRISTLFPNAINPRHGVFTEENLRHLIGENEGRVSATVVAPVPWFPFNHRWFGRYADFTRIPREEYRNGVKILHPRFPVLPKIGMWIAPMLMAFALLPVLKRLISQGDGFDVIDAHYFYPDGVAAVWLGQRLNIPVTVTALGTDVNLIPKFRLPRAQIRWAAKHAQGLASVSMALAQHLQSLGVRSGHIAILRNGVDLTIFRPDPEAGEGIRRLLGLSGQVLISVGGLIERKGHHIVIQAIARIPEVTLLIAGEGPMAQDLRQLVIKQGVAERVHFLGPVPHGELPAYYNAADAFVLASSREGMANVILESLACGTPVVACDAEGVREQLQEPVAGRIVETRNPDAVMAKINDQLAGTSDRSAVREYAERFSWLETSKGQYDLFSQVIADQQ